MTDWTWSAEDSDGKPVTVSDLDVPFESQTEAESWMSDSWADLKETGAAQVSLYADGVLVYGPMSLDEQ